MEKRLSRKHGRCRTSGQDEASLERQRLRNALLSIVHFIFFFPKVNLGQKKKRRGKSCLMLATALEKMNLVRMYSTKLRKAVIGIVNSR